MSISFICDINLRNGHNICYLRPYSTKKMNGLSAAVETYPNWHKGNAKCDILIFTCLFSDHELIQLVTLWSVYAIVIGFHKLNYVLFVTTVQNLYIYDRWWFKNEFPMIGTFYQIINIENCHNIADIEQ